MPQIDLVDETFLVAEPARVAAELHDRATWRAWWPDLALTVFQDRGDAGLRWTVTGGLVGTMEVWLEPWGDGVLLHYYLRADPTAPGSDATALQVDRRTAQRETRRRAWQVKDAVNALKDRLEAGRPVGEPLTPRPQAPTGGG